MANAATERSQSSVWQYFLKLEHDGKRYSRCTFCNVELNGHVASNAKRHLRALHGPQLAEAVESQDRQEKLPLPNVLPRELANLREEAIQSVTVDDCQPIVPVFDFELSDSTSTASDIEESRSGSGSLKDLTKAARRRRQNRSAVARWRSRMARKRKLKKQISTNYSNVILTQLAWIRWVRFFLFDRVKLAESIGARHEPAAEGEPPVDREAVFRMVEPTMSENSKNTLSLIREIFPSSYGLSSETCNDAGSYGATSDTTKAADLDELEATELLHTGNDATSTPELEALWRDYVGSNPAPPHESVESSSSIDAPIPNVTVLSVLAEQALDYIFRSKLCTVEGVDAIIEFISSRAALCPYLVSYEYCMGVAGWLFEENPNYDLKSKLRLNMDHEPAAKDIAAEIVSDLFRDCDSEAPSPRLEQLLQEIIRRDSNEKERDAAFGPSFRKIKLFCDDGPGDLLSGLTQELSEMRSGPSTQSANPQCRQLARGPSTDVPLVLSTVDNQVFCEFNPPSTSWVRDSRFRFGIEGALSPGHVSPQFEQCAMFEIHQAVPGKVVPIARDGHCGYRALACLLFFDEAEHTRIRSLVTRYVCTNAEEQWMRKLFGNADEVRRAALLRMHASSTPCPGEPGKWMTTVDIVAASAVFLRQHNLLRRHEVDHIQPTHRRSGNDANRANFRT